MYLCRGRLQADAPEAFFFFKDRDKTWQLRWLISVSFSSVLFSRGLRSFRIVGCSSNTLNTLPPGLPSPTNLPKVSSIRCPGFLKEIIPAAALGNISIFNYISMFVILMWFSPCICRVAKAVNLVENSHHCPNHGNHAVLFNRILKDPDNRCGIFPDIFRISFLLTLTLFLWSL